MENSVLAAAFGGLSKASLPSENLGWGGSLHLEHVPLRGKEG